MTTNLTTNPVPSDTDRLAEIRARLDAATPGPWKASVVDSPRSTCSTAIYSHAYAAGDARSEVLPSYPIKAGYARMRRADAVLMANARDDLAHLLGLVGDLQGQLAQLPDLETIRRIEKERGSYGMQLAEARRERDALQGQLAKARELHQPERRYTPDDGETSYATYSDAADASFDGSGTPVSVTFFEVCSHCASIEMAEGCDHQYKESLWPCEDARALGLGEGDGQ